MAKFRVTIFLVLLLILSLSLATAVAAAPSTSSSVLLRDFTVELCGDAVCLEWMPSDAAYDFEHVVVWKGDSSASDVCVRGAVDDTGELRIPFHVLRLCLDPSEGVGEVLTFSFRIWALKNHPQYYNRWLGVGKTPVVTIAVPGVNPLVLD